MSADPLRVALTTPGHLRFLSNQPFKENFDQAGGQVVRQSTGHLLFYRPNGRRILATDPAGNPLHECEWITDAQGTVTLSRARFRLDWGQWVGLKPSGLVNETRLNLAAKPGWQKLNADNLRAMAAQALRVPIEEVRFFYRDDDLTIRPSGVATIRQRKDAFYILHDGNFAEARFMSCMGAMNWASIDFLPVVELFKSLLPGTGSAAFELIRGLYDDQNQRNAVPRPLQYRGIPTYPSEAAFRLFSSFFTPQVPAGGSLAFTLFMNQEQSNQVNWLPAATPPIRYFDQAQGICVTVKGDGVQKVTVAQDRAGAPYVNPTSRKQAPLDRCAEMVGGQIILRDRDRDMKLPVAVPRGVHKATSGSVEVSPVDWRSVFVEGMPDIEPADAYGAVLLYPEDGSPINFLAAQPFVADYLQDLAEQDREIGAALSRAERVLIDNGDAVIATCIAFDRPREYTVRVHHAAFAQKQAQQLWTVCAGLQRWDWLSHIRFVSADSQEDQPGQLYDLIFRWEADADSEPSLALAARIKEMSLRLRGGGHAFVVGSAQIDMACGSTGLQLMWKETVEQLPTFRMHRSILPKARLSPGLTLFHLKKI